MRISAGGRAGGQYEEIFVSIFKLYGRNSVRSMDLENHNKNFLFRTSSQGGVEGVFDILGFLGDILTFLIKILTFCDIQ